MEGSSDLMVPVLDALSNLNLQSDVLVSARNTLKTKGSGNDFSQPSCINDLLF